MIFSYLLDPFTSLTRIVISPSSTTVPAYTTPSGTLRTGTDSPVKDAWFTIASPSVTVPSNGITFPIWMRTSSPDCTLSAETSISCPSHIIHTLLMLSDILRARSPTDFLCVHSSSVSPIPSRYITDPAVAKSPRIMETPMAVASSTGTSILPWNRVWSPFQIYFTDFTAVMTARTENGRNSLLPKCQNVCSTSWSQ